MARAWTWRWLGNLIAIGILGSGATAAENSAATPGTVPPGKIDLFDGHSLAGWTFVSKDAAADAAAIWSVTGGAIRCEGKPNGYARTVTPYRDYALHFEWRWPAAAGNSGVFVHVNGPDRVWPNCFEVQLKAGDAGSVRANGGARVRELDLTAKDPKNVARRASGTEKPAGEWNSCDVTCRGDRITITVNGVLENIVTGASATSGTIALQAEGAPVEFRHLELSPLPGA